MNLNTFIYLDASKSIMMNSEELKHIVCDLGAEKCGIASLERFADAPDGFHPRDIYKNCESVVVFLKSMPSAIIASDHPVTYTNAASILYSELDVIGVSLSRILESKGVEAIPIPADTPYMYWDEKRSHGMGILSLRHSAYLAGLGILGKNTLLMNRELGSKVYIGAVLINAVVEADPIADDYKCPRNCTLCLASCPVGSLDGITVNQHLCRKQSIVRAGRAFEIYNCHRCRQICPNLNGYHRLEKVNA
jgi:epoxyqueuosine reductase QueG